MKNKLSYPLSFVFDKLIENSSSEINPVLEVVYREGKYLLNSRRANYSYGTLHKVFQVIFSSGILKGKETRSVLILGFGAGSVAKILQQEKKISCALVGVEPDKKVLELATKYFDLEALKGLELHVTTAEKFVEGCTEVFDLVVVDVFVDLIVPDAVQQRKFIEGLFKVTRNNGIVLYNFVVNSKSTALQFKLLLEQFSSVFAKVEVKEVLESNKMLLAYPQ
jgi:spermidine synthase